jgi:hypothetical protein
MLQPIKNNDYLSLATKMITILLLAFFAGNWIDKKWHFNFPVFTLTFLLISIIGILVKTIKDTSNKK